MKRKWQLVVAGVMCATMLMAPVAEASTYQVQKGDTLTKIAQQHKVTVQNIKEWNGLKNDAIYINQKLVVAKLETAKPSTNSKETTKQLAVQKPLTAIKVEPDVTKNGATVHTIVKGDTLTKIAQQYKVTVADLKQWNTLQSDVIYLGQTLSVSGDDQAQPTTTTELPKEQTADELIQNQLKLEQLIVTQPTVEQSERYAIVVELAKKLIDTPYVYGGNTTAGFDCSGFVSYVYSSAGFHITRKSSLDYFLSDTRQVKTPVPGDLLFFKNTYIPTISHMGIYLGNDEFIHAGAKGVEITSVHTKYWADRLVAYKRYTTSLLVQNN